PPAAPSSASELSRVLPTLTPVSTTTSARTGAHTMGWLSPCARARRRLVQSDSPAPPGFDAPGPPGVDCAPFARDRHTIVLGTSTMLPTSATAAIRIAIHQPRPAHAGGYGGAS